MNRTTSLYLDIIRLLAAFVVLLSHVSMTCLSGGQLGFLSGAGVQAVDMFFVLSGFVIAHVTATKEKDARIYFISRAARIYSVALPTLIFGAVLDMIGTRVDPTAYNGPYQAFSPGVIVRSIFFLNEMWTTHRFPGSDGPYWSLGFEVWYYIAFGVFLFMRGAWRWGAAGASLIFIGPKVAVLFPMWLTGVAAYRISSTYIIPRAVGPVLFALPLVLLVAYQFVPHAFAQPFINLSFAPDRLASTAQDYFLALLFAAHIVGFAAISDYFAEPLGRHARLIRWSAGATFSLYLMHLPAMHVLAALSPIPKSSPWTPALLIGGASVICFLFAEVTERRKDAWRRFILAAFPGKNRSVPT